MGSCQILVLIRRIATTPSTHTRRLITNHDGGQRNSGMVPVLRVPVFDRVRPLISVFLLTLVLLHVPYYFDCPIVMAVIALIVLLQRG